MTDTDDKTDPPQLICYLCKLPIIDPNDSVWKNGFSDKYPFHQACFDKPFPDLAIDDSTPKLSEQCAANGWGFGIYNFGKGESGDRAFFNPCIVERPDGLWLLTRVSENTEFIYGFNSIYAFMLDEAGKVPKVGHKLEWNPDNSQEQHEDPRAVYFPRLNQTAVCCTNFVWYGYNSEPVWTGALQLVGFFDSEWQCKVKHRPPIHGNPATLQNIGVKQYEKSWMPFFNQDKLHIFYKADPWTIFEFGETWEDNKPHNQPGLTWRMGTIRNGTPPVLVGDRFYSFFHSSLPWKSNYRRYYMGAMCFESSPPYKAVGITTEPLLAGSQNDIWGQGKPPCIFPCGAVLRGSKWLISAGQNDLKAIWIEIEHEDLLKRLTAIGKSVTPIFPTTGLSEAEVRRETEIKVLHDDLEKAAVEKAKALKLKRQAAMAHARAVRAEKIRLGIKPKQRRIKRSKLREQKIGR